NRRDTRRAARGGQAGSGQASSSEIFPFKGPLSPNYSDELINPCEVILSDSQQLIVFCKQ
ncbi:MAG TPA: hypothetical protein PLJ87_05795, partial [Anaerolineaceae bacterium]|nr:hypothetical protein [Anaerolineaceae bacterium]